MESEILHFSVQLSSLPPSTTIDKLPDKLLIEIFTNISHKERIRIVALICRRWRQIVNEGRLWRAVNIRSEYGGFSIRNEEAFIGIISTRIEIQGRSLEISSSALFFHLKKI